MCKCFGLAGLPSVRQSITQKGCGHMAITQKGCGHMVSKTETYVISDKARGIDSTNSTELQ